MRHRLRLILTFALILPAARVAPQSPAAQPSPDELQQAAAYFAASDWQHSLDAYMALAKKYPAHALSRFRIGVSLVELGDAAQGENDLREGERLGIAAPNAAFRLAESLAEQRKSEAAMEELKRATASFTGLSAAAIDADPHFSSLKSRPDWSALLDRADALVRPCMHDARFREFDFWVGDWDVRPVGAPAVGPPARNTVTVEDGGCVVMEHWSAAGGSTGQSFNLFDRSIGQWRQTWVDNIGGQHDYRGGLVAGNMVFVGDTPAPNGALGRIPTRLTFFHISKDSVRQFSEVSADSGKTWTVGYDLMYVRRK